MLLSAVSVLVVAQSSSEIPEGLMNNPVYILNVKCGLRLFLQLLSAMFLVLKIRQDIITNVPKPSCKVTVILV